MPRKKRKNIILEPKRLFVIDERKRVRPDVFYALQHIAMAKRKGEK